MIGFLIDILFWVMPFLRKLFCKECIWCGKLHKNKNSMYCSMKCQCEASEYHKETILPLVNSFFEEKPTEKFSNKIIEVFCLVSWCLLPGVFIFWGYADNLRSAGDVKGGVLQGFCLIAAVLILFFWLIMQFFIRIVAKENEEEEKLSFKNYK